MVPILEPGFRLRDAADRASDAFRHCRKRWIELPDGVLADTRKGRPGKAWRRYVDRLADELPRALRIQRRFPLEREGATYTVEGQRIRVDQIVAARNWGIGWEGDPIVIDAIERHVYRSLVHRFVAHIRDCERILTRRDYDPDRMPGLLPNPLEALIRDILNEEFSVANLAPMDEDFLEKTDLRIRYPELVRKRGARVQVGWATDLVSFEKKANQLKLRDEYVFVTPITIAEWVEAPIQEVVGNLAFALRHPSDHPNGPRDVVPEVWRKTIREQVKERALASTAKMRERHAKSGPSPE